MFGPNGRDDNLDRTVIDVFLRTITEFFPVNMGGNVLFFSLNPLK